MQRPPRRACVARHFTPVFVLPSRDARNADHHSAYNSLSAVAKAGF
jgi:hypothetical protein